MHKKDVPRKNTEFSKRIIYGSWAAAITLTLIAVVGTFVDKDITNLTTLACLAWAELTAAHSFYYWKAKNENRAKGVQTVVERMAEQHGVDGAARIAEIIYKE